MRIYLDRFEGAYAVLEQEAEDGTVTSVRVDRSFVSAETREGDVLLQKDEYFETDHEATRARRERILEKLRKLRRSE